MKYSITIILFFLGFSISMFAQDVISAQGEEYTGTNLSVSFTIGEVVIDSYEGSNYSITQGFHQPILDFATGITFSEITGVSVFPNPTSDFINLSFDNIESDLVYELYDAKGKLYTQQKIYDINTIVSLKEFASGAYILFIREKNTTKFNSYKIIKD